jgi:hypothetical protein
MMRRAMAQRVTAIALSLGFAGVLALGTADAASTKSKKVTAQPRASASEMTSSEDRAQATSDESAQAAATSGEMAAVADEETVTPPLGYYPGAYAADVYASGAYASAGYAYAPAVVPPDYPYSPAAYAWAPMAYVGQPVPVAPPMAYAAEPMAYYGPRAAVTDEPIAAASEPEQTVLFQSEASASKAEESAAEEPKATKASARKSTKGARASAEPQAQVESDDFVAEAAVGGRRSRIPEAAAETPRPRAEVTVPAYGEPAYAAAYRAPARAYAPAYAAVLDDPPPGAFAYSPDFDAPAGYNADGGAISPSELGPGCPLTLKMDDRC